VVFAPIKKTRAKLLAEKCTELGAAGFVPVTTDRTERSNVFAVATRAGLDKLSLQVLEAALVLPNPSQEARDDNPERGDAEESSSCWSLRELLDRREGILDTTLFGNVRRLLVCRESSACAGTISVLDALDIGTEKGVDRVAFLVGPEGEWSPEEESLLDQKDRYPFIQSISLGHTVLRAETASIICVGAWVLHNMAMSASCKST